MVTSLAKRKADEFDSHVLHHNIKVAQLESSGVLPKDIGINSYLLYCKGKAKIPTQQMCGSSTLRRYKN